MAQKCVHKGCGKVFTDPDEPCVYHPGPPEFHEGQKGTSFPQLIKSILLTIVSEGWMCCKPRVLTFDEFLDIPPCTTGKHSTVDDTPAPPKRQPVSDGIPFPITLPLPTTRPIAAPQRPASPAVQPIEESDDPDLSIPPDATCKRRSCGASYNPSIPRDEEECIHHPGVPIFHEGSKGWSCCKRRVLEFDEFMKIEGCKKRKRHLFVGKKKDKVADEKVESIRHDFYQTASSVIASFFLKKIDSAKAKVIFRDENTLELDLPTTDGKRYTATYPLWGKIDPEKSQYKIMGTKLEVIFAKQDATSWQTLRSDERSTGEIIQTGRAGRA